MLQIPDMVKADICEEGEICQILLQDSVQIFAGLILMPKTSKGNIEGCLLHCRSVPDEGKFSFIWV